MYHEDTVYFKHPNGQKIYGRLFKPETDEKVPLVVFSHELGVTHQSSLPYAKAIAENGAAAYVFDYRGGSLDSKSDGSMTKMSVKTELADLACVLEHIQKWDFVRHDKVVVIGASLGGLVATLATDKYNDMLAGLILLYPAYQLPEELRGIFDNPETIPTTFMFADTFKLGRAFVADAWDVSPYQTIKNIDKDVLILYGDQDEAVPMRYIEKAVQTFPNAKLHVISGTGHFFPEPDKKAAATKYILEYLKQHDII